MYLLGCWGIILKSHITVLHDDDFCCCSCDMCAVNSNDKLAEDCTESADLEADVDVVVAGVGA